jgi:SAM-dependent methyltransferase
MLASQDQRLDIENEQSADALILRLKNFLKARFPWLFLFLYNSVAVYVNAGPRALIKKVPGDSLILNIGSGINRIDTRVTNVDITPQTNVHVVASAYALPFQSNAAELIISESLLEHLERPEEAILEMSRVLKPGGTLYIVTPFMLGFHSSPHDFYRWTLPGMKVLLKDFVVTESGIAVGPTGAFLAIAREWLAIVLSFGSRTLYQLWILFFMIVFIPLNVLDYLISRYGYASQIAMSYYWIAKKQ